MYVSYCIVPIVTTYDSQHATTEVFTRKFLSYTEAQQETFIQPWLCPFVLWVVLTGNAWIIYSKMSEWQKNFAVVWGTHFLIIKTNLCNVTIFTFFSFTHPVPDFKDPYQLPITTRWRAYCWVCGTQDLQQRTGRLQRGLNTAQKNHWLSCALPGRYSQIPLQRPLTSLPPITRMIWCPLDSASGQSGLKPPDLQFLPWPIWTASSKCPLPPHSHSYTQCQGLTSAVNAL